MKPREFFDLVSEWSLLKREADVAHLSYEQTGDEKYLKSANKAAFFYIALEDEIHSEVDRVNRILKERAKQAEISNETQKMIKLSSE